MRRLLVVLLTLVVCTPVFAMKGVVFTHTGEPIANAKIEVFRSEPIADLVARLFAGAGAATPIVNAATDESGAFALEPKSDRAVRIVVTASGFAPYTALESATDESITVALTSVEQKSGHITASAAPVAGATVFAVSETGEVLTSTRSDARGSYTMPDPAGWAMGLCVVHPDFAPLCQWSFEGRPQRQSIDLKLEKGGSASGKVLGMDGKPVANATIFASEWPLGTTGEDGSFSVKRIPAEVKVLRAVSGNRTGFAPRGTTNMTIALTTGRSITGGLADPKGRPISGAVVHAHSAGQGSAAAMPRWITAVVDEKGNYRFDNLAADEYSLYAATPVEWNVEEGEVDLRKTSSVKHDFTAAITEVIQGIVQDEKRQPVSGALVSFIPKETPVSYATNQVYFVQVPTGPTGRFTLTGYPQQAGRIVALKRGFAAGVSSDLDPTDAKSRSVNVTLPKGVEISGTIVDAEGKAIADAGIVVVTGGTTLGAAPAGSMLAAKSVGEWMHSDSTGTFTINLNPGIHDLSVWKRGYAATDIASIDVSPSTAPMRVVLRAGVEIRGRVVRAGGAAMDGGGIVYAMEANQRGGAYGKMQSDGTFTIDSLEPGTYMLRYSGEDGSDASKVVNAPAANVTLELPALFEILGRVTQKATGEPLQQFNISVSTETPMLHSPRGEDITDSEGKFAQKVPAGSVEVTVRSPGFMSVAQRVTVGPDNTSQTIDFALSKGRKVAGRITGADGKSIADVSVAVGTDDEETTGDEQGEYELNGVSTETKELVFTKQGFVSTRRALSAGSSDERVDVVLDPGRRISGRVVDSKGNPVPEAWISASSEAHNAESQSVQSAADGSFTISGLTTARYSFNASKDGSGEARQNDVDIAKVKSLLFTLGSKESGTIRGSVAGVADGTWLAGWVSATGEAGNANAQVGRDGTFVLKNVPAGEVRVIGTLMSQQRQSSTKPVKVQLSNGGDVEVQLALGGDGSLRGNVTSDGQPLIAANITLWQPNGGGQWRSTTGADGSYEFKGVESGAYSISVMQLGGIQYATEVEVNGASTFDVRIDFTKIEGRVTDSEGNAIAGARITVTATDKKVSDNDAAVVTDSTGGFTVKANAAREYRVSAASKGFASAFATTSGHAPVNLRLTRSAGVRLRLVDTRNGAILTGYVVVTDETGKIQLPIATEKQADGSLLLPLPAGTYQVSASASEYASNTITVHAPSADQSIGLAPGGNLVINSGDDATELIKLVKPTGQEYVRCYCNGIAEIRLSGATTRVNHVAAGAYRMDVIDGHGVVKRSFPVTVAEGQTTTVDARRQ